MILALLHKHETRRRCHDDKCRRCLCARAVTRLQLSNIEAPERIPKWSVDSDRCRHLWLCWICASRASFERRSGCHPDSSRPVSTRRQDYYLLFFSQIPELTIRPPRLDPPPLPLMSETVRHRPEIGYRGEQTQGGHLVSTLLSLSVTGTPPRLITTTN